MRSKTWTKAEVQVQVQIRLLKTRKGAEDLKAANQSKIWTSLKPLKFNPSKIRRKVRDRTAANLSKIRTSLGNQMLNHSKNQDRALVDQVQRPELRILADKSILPELIFFVYLEKNIKKKLIEKRKRKAKGLISPSFSCYD